MKNKLKYNLQNLIGRRVNKRILIIESDDWGCIRMPSKQVFDTLLNQGIPVDKCPYNSNDMLESADDINGVIQCFQSLKDSKGNSLKLTANFIVANPDFEKIRKSDFNEYHFQDFVETYSREQGNLSTFDAIKNAIELGVLQPQLHGREHLQPFEWLSALKSGDSETLFAFGLGVWGHPSKYSLNTGINFSSAFHAAEKSQIDFFKVSITEAQRIFKSHFGFYSKSFIPPRYIWMNELNETLKENNIELLQGKIVQLQPEFSENNSLKAVRVWQGKKLNHGVRCVTRNVFFEPAEKPKFNWESDAFSRIQAAFNWGKPAVISMHRLNFMGGLNPENRENNLERLRKLIVQVLKTYPDVEFQTTDQLAELY